MILSDLQGKNVCILGFGREGKAILNAMEKQDIAAEVTIADQSAGIELQAASCKPAPTISQISAASMSSSALPAFSPAKN